MLIIYIQYIFTFTSAGPFRHEKPNLYESDDDADPIEPKNNICYKYRDTGDCPYGEECKFVHEEDDQNESKAICYQFRDTGECPYGEECKFKHVEKDETVKKICRFYSKTGSCKRFKSECPFR